jgi:hypothetical protein
MVTKVEIFKDPPSYRDEFDEWLQEKQETNDIHIVSTLYIGERSCVYIFYEEFEKGHKDIQLVQMVSQDNTKPNRSNRFTELEIVQ